MVLRTPLLADLTETNPQTAGINPNEIAKMRRIRDRWGARLVWACTGTAVRPELLAALVANESDGNAAATHLESSILTMFENILAGRPVHWKPLARPQLERLTPEQRKGYATGWGLTQITGYHIFPRDPHELLDADTCLRETVVLLEDFLRRYALDPAKQAEELLHCWNGGGPHNRTVPGYVENGLRHMKTYEALQGAGVPGSHPQAAASLQAPPPAEPRTEGGSHAGPPRPASPSASLSEDRSQEPEARSQEEKA